MIPTSRIDPALWPILRSGAYMRPVDVVAVGKVMADQEPAFTPIYVESVVPHGRGIINERVAERPRSHPKSASY